MTKPMKWAPGCFVFLTSWAAMRGIRKSLRPRTITLTEFPPVDSLTMVVSKELVYPLDQSPRPLVIVLRSHFLYVPQPV